MKINFNLESEIRLDKFMIENLENLSRSKIQSIIKEGNVLINDSKILKPSFLLSGKGILSLNDVLNKNDISLEKWDRKDLIDIIFENDDFIVLNKPKNLLVHPGSGNKDKTLVNILQTMDIKLANEFTNRPGIVHRLDKNTTGILIISKNNRFLEHLQNQFMTKKVDKKYIGLVEGHLKNKKILVDASIGRNKKNRILMDIVSKDGKDSQTIFEVMERFIGFDLVEFSPLTGRTHQIRVHSKYIGHPIFNDPDYGKETEKDLGQYLHAKSIKFLDLDNNEMYFEAKLPDFFKNKINQLRGYNSKDVKD